MKLSLQIKLITDESDKDLLRRTQFAYNSACNFVSRYAFENKVFQNFTLHTALYNEVRSKFDLPSQLAVSVFNKVSYAYKTELTKCTKEKRELSLCKFNKYGAVVYDSRILTYGKDNIVSIKTLDKRIQLQSCIYAPNRIPYFKGEADLIYKNGEFYILQTIDIPKASKIDPTNYIGIDLGIVQIATDSDGISYSGDLVKKKRIQYSSHRTRLQKRNTKSSKRRLKTIGNKESRFRKDVNHQISKAIIEKAKSTSQGIVLEDLIQFFDKTRVRKSQRNERSSWSFFQLRSFIQYKADLAGVPVKLINPAYTSQMCNKCGYTDSNNRKSQAMFLCVACGHTENADINAAKNIRAAVNQPIAPKPQSGLVQATPLVGVVVDIIVQGISMKLSEFS